MNDVITLDDWHVLVHLILAALAAILIILLFAFARWVRDTYDTWQANRHMREWAKRNPVAELRPDLLSEAYKAWILLTPAMREGFAKAAQEERRASPPKS